MLEFHGREERTEKKKCHKKRMKVWIVLSVIVSYVSSTNFDEIEEWVKNGEKKFEPVGKRRRLGDKIGAKCAMTNAVRSRRRIHKKITQNERLFFYEN